MDSARLLQDMKATHQARTGQLVLGRSGPVRVPDAHEIDDVALFADKLSRAGLLPEAYRFRPANILFAVELAKMLQLPTMAVILGVWVIEGRVSTSAAMVNMLVRRAGHKLRLHAGKSFREPAYAEIVRNDDPDFPFRAEWDLQRAVDAGLVRVENGKPVARDEQGKPLPWERYTPQLFKARATTEVARDAAQDALFGLHYTPEELGAEVDRDGVPTGRMLDPADSDQAYHYDEALTTEQALGNLQETSGVDGADNPAPDGQERIAIDHPAETIHDDRSQVPLPVNPQALLLLGMDWSAAIAAAILSGIQGVDDLSYAINHTESDNTWLISRVAAVKKVLSSDPVDWDDAIEQATRLGLGGLRDLWCAAKHVAPANTEVRSRISAIVAKAQAGGDEWAQGAPLSEKDLRVAPPTPAAIDEPDARARP